MAATGEASGTMPEMLAKGADFLDRDIDRIIKRLIVLLEPTLTIALAAVVGLILLAVYLPMFDLFQTATR
jgi:type IV pilus assembly protein PilC